MWPSGSWRRLNLVCTTTKGRDFWNVTTCRMVNIRRPFWAAHCLLIQDIRIKTVGSWTRRQDSSPKRRWIYQSKRRNIPEDMCSSASLWERQISHRMVLLILCRRKNCKSAWYKMCLASFSWNTVVATGYACRCRFCMNKAAVLEKEIKIHPVLRGKTLFSVRTSSFDVHSVCSTCNWRPHTPSLSHLKLHHVVGWQRFAVNSRHFFQNFLSFFEPSVS